MSDYTSVRDLHFPPLTWRIWLDSVLTPLIFRWARLVCGFLLLWMSLQLINFDTPRYSIKSSELGLVVLALAPSIIGQRALDGWQIACQSRWNWLKIECNDFPMIPRVQVCPTLFLSLSTATISASVMFTFLHLGGSLTLWDIQISSRIM